MKIPTKKQEQVMTKWNNAKKSQQKTHPDFTRMGFYFSGQEINTPTYRVQDL